VRMTDPLSELNDPLAEGHHQITVLDFLVRTILCQNATDKTSIREFKKLKDSFSEWEDVRTAASDKVTDAIREGGLSEVKTERIKMLLNHLKEERGECCLEWLREKDTDFVKEYFG
jgi:endonuclease-3